MSLIQLPQPGPAAQTAGLLRNRGAISAGSQEAQSWEALAALGQKLEQKADEWRQRQDRFAIAMATVDMDQARDAWEVEQDRRTDLHLLDKDGIVGYDAAVNDYGKYLEDITNKTGSRIPKSYRQMWMAQQKQENETRLAKFTNAMIDRRTADSKVFFRNAVRRLATGEGFPIPGMMGAPTTNLPVNPEAAIEFAASQIDVIPPDEQQEYLDWTLEQVFYGVLNQSPKDAVAFLEKSKDRFDTKTWHFLMARAKEAASREKDQMAVISDEQKRALRESILLDIDEGKDTSLRIAQEGMILAAPDEKKAVSARKLSTWNANRFRQVETKYTDMAELMDDAIKAKLSGDTHETLMKLADARYGDKATLSADDYKRMRDFLAKDYKPHELTGIRRGFNAINAMTWTRGVFEFGMHPTWDKPPAARMEDTQAFLSWYDSQREKGMVPDDEACYVMARKIMVQDRPTDMAAMSPGVTGRIAGDRAKELDDPEVPDELKKLIGDARKNGWSDDEILSSDEWQAYVGGK